MGGLSLPTSGSRSTVEWLTLLLQGHCQNGAGSCEACHVLELMHSQDWRRHYGWFVIASITVSCWQVQPNTAKVWVSH